MTGWFASLRIAGLLLGGLAVASAAHGQGRNPLICEPVPGVVPLLDRYERVMVIADRPGTRELPAMFGEIACAFSARGPLVVGVEWLTDLQPWLDAFMASDGSEEARLALVNILDPHPRSDMATYATIEMLERLRRLSHAGRDVRILAWLIPELEEMPPPIEPPPSDFDSAFDVFDPDEDLSVPPADEVLSSVDIWRANMHEPESLEEAREAYMADMIQAVSDPRARLLLLASRERAKRAPVKTPGLSYPSFAMTFPPGSVFAMDVRHGYGEAWTCDAGDCRVHAIPSAGPGDIRMITQSPVQSGGFDGLVHLGRVSASAPAQPPPPQIAYELYFENEADAAPDGQQDDGQDGAPEGAEDQDATPDAAPADEDEAAPVDTAALLTVSAGP